MPGWKDLDAVEMAPALSIIWSWKYDAKSKKFIGRLAGDEIRSIWGRPIANAPMAEYFADWNYEHILRRHNRVVNERCIGVERGVVFEQEEHHGFGER